MAMIYKATPQPVLKGIRDESKKQLPVESTQLPQHLPIFFLLTEKSSEINIVGGTAAKIIYGEKTFDPLSDFYTHQTVGANVTLGNANQIMVVPIKLPGVKKAAIRLALELVAATVDDVDATGAIIGKKNVWRVIWHSFPIDASGLEGFGKADINATYRDGNFEAEMSADKLGALIDTATSEAYYTPSALFPIMDLEVLSPGSYGNNYAISIDAPNARDVTPPDTTFIQLNKALVYRISMFNKASAGANPINLYNNYGELSSDFVLVPNFVNKTTNLNMSLGHVVTERYQTIDDPNRPPIVGPFPEIAVYQDNIEEVARILGAPQVVTAVSANNTNMEFTIPGLYENETIAEENLYMVNIFTGEDLNGYAYRTTDFSSSRKFGGIRLGKNSIVYAQGGDDGFPMKKSSVNKLELARMFDSAVFNWCQNFNELNPLYDSAKYPFSTIWDTGFSLPTKKALMLPTGQHKRIWTCVGTHSVADYGDANNPETWRWSDPLNGAEEISLGMMLKSYGLMIPESEEFGTQTVRIALCSRSGKMIDGSYPRHLPLTIELIDKVSKYCGAGDTIWDPAEAFDSYPNNKVNLMKDINITYQSPSVYNKSWDAGLMWVQNDDIRSTFFPAFRTIYPNDTSVLTSLINMIGACYLERVCEIVWRKLVGNGKLTNDEFIEESDRMIAEEVNGKFDGRFRIVPHTYFTSADETLGYQWSTDIELFANNIKTVGKFTIISRRMADYVPIK